MNRIDELLGSSLLPFVGRAEELDRLVAFWRGTEESDRLRSALLIGEAGIGKSRLVEELIPRIEQAGGVVLHTRIYPGGLTSIAPIIARAIWSSRTARTLLRSEPEGSLGAVVATVTRLTRLRPTLLVIEDTDLLGEETLRELLQFVEALAQEPLALLTLSRPVEHAANAALERYRVEEIELSGLPTEHQAELWSRIFDINPDPVVIDALATASRGNPLAVRSALRGAVRSGAIQPRSDGTGIDFLSSHHALERIFLQNVESVPIGLIAHLTQEERKGAEQLAALGEIFAREAGEALVADSEILFQRLMAKGIIAISAWWTSPLPGPESHYPLYVFTHSLLHVHLSRAAAVEPSRMLGVVGRGLPLYSTVPILLSLRDNRTPAEEHSPNQLYNALRRLLETALRLNEGSHWQNALEIWAGTKELIHRSRMLWQPDELRRLDCAIHDVRLHFFQRGGYSDEYHRWVIHFRELTEETASVEEAEQRVSALLHHHELEFRRSGSAGIELWNEVELLIDRYPSLLETGTFGNYLHQIARIAWAGNSAELAEKVERQLNRMAAHSSSDPDHVTMVHRKVGIYLLTRFETMEELRHRLQMLAEIERSSRKIDLNLLSQKIELFFRIGRFAELKETFAVALPLYGAQGLHRLEYRYRFMSFLADFAATGRTDDFDHRLRELLESSRTVLPEQYWRFVTNATANFALLQGEIAWGARMVNRFPGDLRTLPLRSRILSALETNHPDALEDLLSNGAAGAASDAPVPIARMIRAIAGSTEDATLVDDLFACADLPLLSMQQAADLRLVLELILLAKEAGREVPIVRNGKAIAGRVLASLLPWLAEREYLPALRSILGRFGAFLDEKGPGEWIERKGDYELPTAGDERIRISMLGTILITRHGDAPYRVRGARLSSLLGLMVVDRMLHRPMTLSTLRRLAFDVGDSEYGRKMFNAAVWRLREILGRDTIRTDGETPRLDLDRVSVDVLQAGSLLERAAAGLRSAALIRAVPALLAALRITRGEVLFPGLYDDIFEAARDDFETRLREMAIDIAGALLHAGDAARAEEVLRQAMVAIPGDEDINALLRQALADLGRRAEARTFDLDSPPAGE